MQPNCRGSNVTTLFGLRNFPDCKVDQTYNYLAMMGRRWREGWSSQWSQVPGLRKERLTDWSWPGARGPIIAIMGRKKMVMPRSWPDTGRHGKKDNYKMVQTQNYKPQIQTGGQMLNTTFLIWFSTNHFIFPNQPIHSSESYFLSFLRFRRDLRVWLLTSERRGCYTITIKDS